MLLLSFLGTALLAAVAIPAAQFLAYQPGAGARAGFARSRSGWSVTG